MAADPSLHPETLTVGHGYDPVNGMGAAKPPIFLTSTFVYGSAAEAKDSHRLFFDGPREGEAAGSPHIYSRLGHPNLDMVEARLAAIDGAEAAAGFATGLAAVSTILLAHLQPGDCVLHSLPVYGGTDMMIGQVMTRFGTKAFHFSDGLDGTAIRKAADEALAAGRDRPGAAAAEIPHPEEAGGVASRPERLGDRDDIGGQLGPAVGGDELVPGGARGLPRIDDRVDAVAGRVLPRHQAGPRRGAVRGARVRLREHDPTAGERVDVRRLDER
ncbi:MAG: hypothetical protein EBS42_13305, partial [Caulobacteraceae bacterium]|nr:hypothetical protein [Caulobacteraceae bacterium]